ncbi:MAG: hypothetical protein H6R12_113 [Proteobacteria bacterium]|nr:hypothetical protein [Pseudomonadota bacterium]
MRVSPLYQQDHTVSARAGALADAISSSAALAIHLLGRFTSGFRVAIAVPLPHGGRRIANGWRQAGMSSRRSGSPAVVEPCSLDRKLCVPAFRSGLPWSAELLGVFPSPSAANCSGPALSRTGQRRLLRRVRWRLETSRLQETTAAAAPQCEAIASTSIGCTPGARSCPMPSITRSFAPAI